jgi:Mg-chelatase subunit ChlD
MKTSLKVNNMLSKRSALSKEVLEEVDLDRAGGVTYIGLALDESASMEDYYEEALDGFNLQLDTIRRLAEHEVKVWLTTFNHQPREKLAGVPVSSIENLREQNYRPGGGTALLDAADRLIESLEKKDKGTHGDAFLVVVFSDGQENSSRYTSWRDLGTRVTRLQATGRWTFVFIGPKAEHQRMENAGFKELLDFDQSMDIEATLLENAKALAQYLRARNVGGLLPAYFPKKGSES